MQVAETEVRLPHVSTVQPFERGFWSRFDAALDFGYSMTRTNSAKQLSLGTNLSYRDERPRRRPLRQCLQELAGNAPETSAGTWATTSDTCWARAGT